MSFRLSEDDIPDEQPHRDREFLWECYHDQGLSPRTIAYELDIEVAHVTVYMERLGVLRPWRHEPTLRRLYVERGLSAEEIAARDEFDCSPVTIRKWLARYDLIDDEPDEITYGRLDELGSESPAPTA
jgi:hypothetical protein